ncbi:unnamed protein product [Nezara viridula]|uniref:Uncharacterized protein n=1 Tax=Nezara viridula TaxID=85310 RepID=A0A9P0MUG0_NEZVI|nr:unnamed protein product [Nezara viridula]
MSQKDEENPSSQSTHSEVKFTDKKIIDVVKNMIRKTSIPGPGDELYNDLYQVLVKNLSSDLRKSIPNELEAEVTARKLAAWVLTFDEQLKIAGENAEDQVEQTLPGNPYYYNPAKDGNSSNKRDGNVKLYNLSEHHSQPYWQGPGKVVKLKDEEGSQIYVKGLDESEGKRTLVKKIKKTNKGKEVSSWIVEVADREQMESAEENARSGSGIITPAKPTANSKLKDAKSRTPVTTARKEEARNWKNLLGPDKDNEAKSKSAGTSKSADRHQQDVNIPKTRQKKTNQDRISNASPKQYLMDAADLKRSLKSFQKMNLNLNPRQENYLINELNKRSTRRT